LPVIPSHSPALTYIFCHLHLALTFWQPSASSQCERAKDLSFESCSPARKRSLALQSPPPTKRPRRCVEHTPEPASPPVQAISRYRRVHGVEPPAINAEFEINPTSNAGVPFAFDEVVRGRRQRQALNAGECEECRDVRVYSFHKKKLSRHSGITIPSQCR
jgi:hypothetical protein